MVQKHRILTEIGKDQKITVELKQDYDLLEILSLKFTQQEAYTSLCADYGVVCGRISVNDGFGVPNARVSIFVPLSDEDAEDPVIKSLYPYTTTVDRNDAGYRYNLLPSRKQHSGHTPTGTFPDQEDILTREEVLEVYEKYYKYTVKTNDSGDFMIWGVPVGSQTLHAEVDLSDMGCQSMVPYDFIYEGTSPEKFENGYTYMSSDNIDGLPQIVTFEKTIEVYPFWGNQDLCEIGITRTDFDLKEQGIRIEPYAIMMGGTFTDSGKDALRVNCNVDNQMGEKCRLTTFKGDIEAIRFSGVFEKNSDGTTNYSRPILEAISIDSQIDEHGRFFFRVPMNTRRLVTDEFGNLVETKDPRKGIATEGTYRFRFSLNEDTGERNRYTAKFLVPNIREIHTDDLGSELGRSATIDKKSYAFSTNLDDYPDIMIPYMTGTDSQSIAEGKFGVPQDYFYSLRYNRVYTVTQYINKYFKQSSLESRFNFLVRDRRESFIGIKEIWPAEKDDCAQTNNYFPINEAVRNHRFNFFIISFLILLEQAFNTITLFIKEFVLKLLFDLAATIQGFPFKKIKQLGNDLMIFTKKLQFSYITRFSLVTYPDCQKCTEDNINDDLLNLVGEVDINEVRDGTVGTLVFENQDMVEQYTTSLGSGCREYSVTETSGVSGTTFSYTVCGGNSATYDMGAGEVKTIYSETTPTPTSGTITVVDNGSASGSNLDTDLYFTTAQKQIIQSATWSNGEIETHRYVLEVEIVPSSVGEKDPQGFDLTGSNDHYYYFIIGNAAQYPIDEGDYSINGLYGDIAETIALIYNKNIDETVNNTCHTSQGSVKIKRLIYIDTPEVDTLSSNIEEGCSKYDTIYDPDGKMNLVALTLPTGDGIPLSGGTTTYGNLTGSPYNVGMITSEDLNSIGFDGSTYAGVRDFLISRNYHGENLTASNSPLNNPWLNRGSNNTNVVKYPWPLYNQLDGSYDISWGDDEDPCGVRPQKNYAAVVSLYTRNGVADGRWWQNRSYRCIVGAPFKARANKKRRKTKTGNYMDPENKGTISGYSEFRDGVYAIVPLAGRNTQLLNDYIRRKRLGMIMCGGITSYIFTDSWLSGALYFFQFMKRGSSDSKRYCTDNLVHVKDDNGTHFYYRSTPWSPDYNPNSSDYNKGFFGQNRFPLQTASRKEINYPTTIIDLGPRTSWINEVCVDPELDPNCSVVRSIGSTSYKPIDDLMEYVLQSKEIKEKGRLDAEDLFDVRGRGRMDGDIVQLLNYNTQTGIYPFEIEEADSPYLEYIDNFDGVGPVGINFIYSEDDPDTETVEYNGYRIRVCLNKPGYLGDKSQYVPYYRWNTWGHGFGDKTAFANAGKGEAQDWMDNIIYTQRIQEMKGNMNLDQNNNSSDDYYYDAYALPPIRDCLEINGVASQENDNYKEYNGNHHMELTGPFHYVFGIRKGNTAWDKFVEMYGPK